MLPFLPELPGAALILITLASLWGLLWKGIALWRAAGRRELKWFIALLVVNAAGTLETFYLLRTRKERWRMWPFLISIMLLGYILFVLATVLPSSEFAPPIDTLG